MYKKYSKTIKQKAISHSKKIGITKASRELGISIGAIHTWAQKKKNLQSPPTNKEPLPEFEYQELREKYEQLELENKILLNLINGLLDYRLRKAYQ